MAEWFDSLQHILDGCASAIATHRPPDSGTTLDAIDRALMRFNQCASEVQAPLRRSHPQLAGQLRRCTDLAYDLRNHTRTYLLRAADALALEIRGHLPAPARSTDSTKLIGRRRPPPPFYAKNLPPSAPTCAA